MIIIGGAMRASLFAVINYRYQGRTERYSRNDDGDNIIIREGYLRKCSQAQDSGLIPSAV